MSRDGRDDDREADLDRADDRDPARAAQREADIQERIADVPARDLDLPQGDEREVVEFRGQDYRLNGDDVRALATTGAFRVVSAHDLADAPEGTSRHLIDQGLMTRETIVDQTGAHHVFALTRDGKGLLEAHQHPVADRHQQVFYAEVVKPRELRHDAQLASAYRAEAARIEREGGRVTRVVLDYELKREYQQYLHRDGADNDHVAEAVRLDRIEFAHEHDLPIVDGHLELPDLRIEYGTEDGRLAYRDVEVLTEHYSRGQRAGKAQAGFVCYRPGGTSSRGGTPFDPHLLTRL